MDFDGVAAFAAVAFASLGGAVFASALLTGGVFAVTTEEDARAFGVSDGRSRRSCFAFGGGDDFALADVAIVREFDAIFVPGFFIGHAS